MNEIDWKARAEAAVASDGEVTLGDAKGTTEPNTSESPQPNPSGKAE